MGVINLTGEGDKVKFARAATRRCADYGGYQDGLRRASPERAGFPAPDSHLSKTGCRDGRGYSIGGGHVLHMMRPHHRGGKRHLRPDRSEMAPLTAAGALHIYGAYVGQKKAREIWFLCRQYDAQQALDMGLVNTVVFAGDSGKETVRWCREMLQNSLMALRCLKAALNADCDGQGQAAGAGGQRYHAVLHDGRRAGRP